MTEMEGKKINGTQRVLPAAGTICPFVAPRLGFGSRHLTARRCTLHMGTAALIGHLDERLPRMQLMG